uniref:Uncharacterized protein n=1 Tax=Arundo donax TaxID=35708 RepID=A0A0A8Z5Z6_ARUDO
MQTNSAALLRAFRDGETPINGGRSGSYQLTIQLETKFNCAYMHFL